MHTDDPFRSLLLLTVLAAGVPFALGWLRRWVRLPIVVGEIVAGIVVGQSGLDLIHPSPVVDFLAEFGFIFLMFLSGLELDVMPLATAGRHGERPAWYRRPGVLALANFGLSVGLAMLAGVGVWWMGMARDPVLMGLILSTTSLGIVVPVLKERGLTTQPYGQTILMAALLADFVTLLFLGLEISFVSKGWSADLLLFGVLLLAFVLAARLSRFLRGHAATRRIVDELAHATSQIRVRWAFAVIVGWVVLAGALGVEVILGAFLAGAIISQGRAQAHPIFEEKLDAIGFGFFIPIFFIMVGARFDLPALVASDGALLLVPLLIAAAYGVKVVPALVFRFAYSWREAIGGGVLLSSRLSLIVAAAAIARQLDLISSATDSAIVLVAVFTCTVSPVLFNRILPAQEGVEREGVIILGADTLAELLGTRLLHAGEKVTFVGRASPRLEKLRDTGATVVAGDADDEATLAAAGAATARAVVALPHDNAKLWRACQLARQAFEVPRVVARAQLPEDVQALHALGVQVVQPAMAMTLGLEGALHFPAALSMLIDKNDEFDLADAPLRNPELFHRMLRDVRLPGRALVLGIRREGQGEVVVPTGDTWLEEGDVLVLCGNSQALADAGRFLAGAGRASW